MAEEIIKYSKPGSFNPNKCPKCGSDLIITYDWEDEIDIDFDTDTNGDIHRTFYKVFLCIKCDTPFRQYYHIRCLGQTLGECDEDEAQETLKLLRELSEVR